MRRLFLFSLIINIFYIFSLNAAQSDKHTVILDSIEVIIEQSFSVGLSVIADKIAPDEKPGKMGFGSFCIPMKYNKDAFVADSVVYKNTLISWDEKFANPKIDTGFVSLAGIYDMGGKDNTPIYSPNKPEKIAELFFSVRESAEPGVYKIELTIDPRQNKIFLGSPNGLNSVTPRFKPGIMVVKK